jgi:hypothetical protein
LFETLERFELWPNLAATAQSAWLDAPDGRSERVEQSRWVAIAAYRQNDLAAGDQWQAKIADELAACQNELKPLQPPFQASPDGPATAAFPENGANARRKKDLEAEQKRIE